MRVYPAVWTNWAEMKGHLTLGVIPQNVYGIVQSFLHPGPLYQQNTEMPTRLHADSSRRARSSRVLFQRVSLATDLRGRFFSF